MNSPVSMVEMNREEVVEELDAILCVDTTKGNRIYNKKELQFLQQLKKAISCE